MTISRRRVIAIVRKELAEFRHNRSIIAGMAILPLVFLIQPLVAVLGLRGDAAGGLRYAHVLVYMLGIPALVPVIVAAYAVAGERQQGTLEPALTTPIRREEFLLAKAIAALIPSLGIAYGVFGLYLLVIARFGDPAVVGAMVQLPDIVAQIVFTPLIALWSVWVGIAMSTRASDLRVAQQVGMLASLPPVFIAALVAFGAIASTLQTARIAAIVLIGLDLLGWRVVSRLFDRERLITGTR